MGVVQDDHGMAAKWAWCKHRCSREQGGRMTFVRAPSPIHRRHPGARESHDAGRDLSSASIARSWSAPRRIVAGRACCDRDSAQPRPHLEKLEDESKQQTANAEDKD